MAGCEDVGSCFTSWHNPSNDWIDFHVFLPLSTRLVLSDSPHSGIVAEYPSRFLDVVFKTLGQGFLVVFPGRPRRAKNSSKIDSWGPNKHHCFILYFVYVFWRWPVAINEWKVDWIWAPCRLHIKNLCRGCRHVMDGVWPKPHQI